MANEIELEITTLIHGGSGLGHHDGKAVFVAGAVPGDVVRCRLVQEKKRYAKAELVAVVAPSTSRRQPPCAHFEQCGGCDWQQLSYADQCHWKQQLFSDSCQRQLRLDEALIRPLVASPQAMGYRSRVQFKCYGAPGGFALGFYRRGSHFVIDIDHCPVIDPAIEALRPQLKALFDRTDYAGWVPQIDVAVGDDEQCRVIIHYRGQQQAAFCDWLRPRVAALSAAVFVQCGRKSSLVALQGETDLTICVDEPPLQLSYGPGGFAQVNLAQNKRLVELVLEALPLDGSERVLDLYCGMGNFSLPLARRAAHVVGVEDYAPSIDSARRNAAANGVDNCQFFAEPAEAFMQRWQQPVDVVVLDPPRSGAKQAIDGIVRCAPKRMVYVSCDQQTLMRDLQQLLHHGYRLLSAQAVDMFPQTCHTEVVAVLERCE